MEDSFAFNLYKRPSPLRQEALNRYKTGGQRAVEEWLDSLPVEDQRKVIREVVQAMADEPLMMLVLASSHFSSS